MALDVFTAMSTQWNISATGRYTGMNYAALPAVYEALRVPRGQRAEVFAGFRTMEIEAVQVIRSIQEKQK